MGTLAKERADFLIVEASDYFDGARVSIVKAGGNKGLDSGKGAELVIDAARKDEFFVQAAKLSRLSVEELELPVDDAAIWLILVNRIVCKSTTLTILDVHLSCYCFYQSLWLCSREGPSAA